MISIKIIVIIILTCIILAKIIENDMRKKIENDIKNVIHKEENIVLPSVKEKKNVPKNIFQTHRSRDLVPNYYINNLRKLNPDWDYHFYDNNRCINFLKKEFGQIFVDKFNSFKSGAHKSDLWRLCILYKYGGCYIDADMEMIIPLNHILEYCKQDLIIPQTRKLRIKRPFNAFIICKPGNKLIGECLKKIMAIDPKKCEENYLFIIHLMEKILDKKIEFELIEKYHYFFENEKGHYVYIGDKKIAKSKRQDYIK